MSHSIGVCHTWLSRACMRWHQAGIHHDMQPCANCNVLFGTSLMHGTRAYMYDSACRSTPVKRHNTSCGCLLVQPTHSSSLMTCLLFSSSSFTIEERLQLCTPNPITYYFVFWNRSILPACTIIHDEQQAHSEFYHEMHLHRAFSFHHHYCANCYYPVR